MGNKHYKYNKSKINYGSISTTKYTKLTDEPNIPTWLMPAMYRYHHAIKTKNRSVVAEIEKTFDILEMSLLLDMYHLDNSMIKC